MYSPHDTIVAIATPPGHGGIGVVRVSGPRAHPVALRLTGRALPLQPRHATFARVETATGVTDQAVVTYFKAPHSYTGEDVVEISAHGSPVLLRELVRAAMDAGGRLAEPGEFTFRAYLNGRIDLVQAEAVRDLIDAVTPLQARVAFDQLEGTLTGSIRVIAERLFELTAKLEASIDFPDEGYHFVTPGAAGAELAETVDDLSEQLRNVSRGRLIREGLQVAILGRPNVGKSSLFNRLAGAGRAIVAAQPGTTRDLVTEKIDLLGVPVTVVDTAGLRSEISDPVETEGVARARAACDAAAVVVVVLDRSAPLTSDDRQILDTTASRPRVVVANKSDLPRAWEAPPENVTIIEMSAVNGSGMDYLRMALLHAATPEVADRDIPSVTNLRHADLLVKARSALERAREAAAVGRSEELVLADIQEARSSLEEVTGLRTPDDVLAAIFSRFCIGK